MRTRLSPIRRFVPARHVLSGAPSYAARGAVSGAVAGRRCGFFARVRSRRPAPLAASEQGLRDGERLRVIAPASERLRRARRDFVMREGFLCPVSWSRDV